MIVFRTFWSVVKKYKGTVILYTVLLIGFGGMNMKTSDSSTMFVASKPDVLIISEDEKVGLTKNLIDYIEQNSNSIKIKNNQTAISDALFYREVNYIIYIPKGYRMNVLALNNPEINIQSTGDYQASLAEMMLRRYIQVQNVYINSMNSEEEAITAINNTLSKKSHVGLTSKVDINETSKASFYFNFASYSIMAVIIFVVCLVLSSFHEKAVNKRTIASSINYKKYNRQLLLASFVYSVFVWLLFVILGFIVVGDVLLSFRGVIYICNAFIFTFCSLSIALLISTLIYDKNAVSGIVNVVALGSAFLCGAFVPAKWLPSSVLTFAHFLPSYWYIHSNDLLKEMEIINFESLYPIIENMLVILSFTLLFIIINNSVSKKRQKIES